jgi:hypothetical protein
MRTALLVDGIGSGVFMPFSTLYFLRATDISLPTVGATLPTAGLLALTTPLPLGPMVDRWGPPADGGRRQRGVRRGPRRLPGRVAKNDPLPALDAN